MNHATNFFINREASMYRQRLSIWEREITCTRDDLDAFRTAANSPAVGGMLASMRGLVLSDRNRAEQAVLNNLTDRLSKMNDQDLAKHERFLRQVLAGHYPTLYREVDNRLRAASSQGKAS